MESNRRLTPSKLKDIAGIENAQYATSTSFKSPLPKYPKAMSQRKDRPSSPQTYQSPEKQAQRTTRLRTPNSKASMSKYDSQSDSRNLTIS